MAIYITGDTHREDTISKIMDFKGGKNDIVIICGDFGLILPTIHLELFNILSKKEFKILFVDGNHDNHAYLNSLDTVTWSGGEVHFISDNIIHLKRGQVFCINGKSFLTLGGARTINVKDRVEGVNWWREEMPSIRELKETLYNCCKNNFKVDYIITHDTRTTILHTLCKNYNFNPNEDYLNKFLEKLYDKLNFKHWYFGHYHLDIENIKKNETAVYNKIIKICD